MHQNIFKTLPTLCLLFFLSLLPCHLPGQGVSTPSSALPASLGPEIKHRVINRAPNSFRQIISHCGIPAPFSTVASLFPGWENFASESRSLQTQPAVVKAPLSGAFNTAIDDQPGRPATVCLKILDANLWGLPFPFADRQESRLRDFIALAKDFRPDLILLQEIWMPPWIDALHQALPEYWLIHPEGGFYLPSGLLILSRTKPLDASFAQFPGTLDHSLLELFAGKGLLKVTLRVQRQICEVFTSHLYAANNSTERAIADAQVRLLAASITVATVPMVLAGDLNTRPAALRALFPGKWIWEENLASPTTVRKDKKIDYLLLRLPDDFIGTVSASPLLEPSVSDHLPLIGSVTWKNLHGG